MPSPLTPTFFTKRAMNQSVAPRNMNVAARAKSAQKYPRSPTQVPAAARTALRLLDGLQHGLLTVHLPDGSVRGFGASAPAEILYEKFGITAKAVVKAATAK